MSFYAKLWGGDVLGPFPTSEDARAAFLRHVHDPSKVQWVASDDEPGVELANDGEGELLGEVWEQDQAPEP